MTKRLFNALHHPRCLCRRDARKFRKAIRKVCAQGQILDVVKDVQGGFHIDRENADICRILQGHIEQLSTTNNWFRRQNVYVRIGLQGFGSE
jgi:hypothetical protein